MRPFTPLTLAGSATAVALAVVAAAVLGAVYALPIVAALVLWLVFLLSLRAFGVRRAGERDAEDTASSGSDGAIPTWMVDDERPLGDTAQAHDEISPHDLPMGHPGRRAAEEQAARGDSATTTGNVSSPAGSWATRAG